MCDLLRDLDVGGNVMIVLRVNNALFVFVLCYGVWFFVVGDFDLTWVCVSACLLGLFVIAGFCVLLWFNSVVFI